MRPLDLTDFLLMKIAAHLTKNTPEELFSEYEAQRPKTARTSAKADDADVDEIYSAYPCRDPNNGNRSLGKSIKDRDRIRRLLAVIPKETILDAIRTELEESNTTGKWLRNFSTFLNNLPDNQEERRRQESIYQ